MDTTQQEATPHTTLTPQAIEDDPMNAVLLDIPQDASRDFLRDIRSAADGVAAQKFEEMEGLRSGELEPPAEWSRAAAAGEAVPDVHEEAEAQWLNAVARSEQAATRIEAQGGHLAEQPAPTSVPDLLGERITTLLDTVGGNNTPAHEAYSQAQDMHAESVQAVSDPQAAAALERGNDALRQDYAADLASVAAAQAETSGNFEDATAMTLEADTRREIAQGLRGDPSDPQGATSTPAADDMPPTTPEGSTFAQDAADAARAFGFGPSARTIFVQSTEGQTMGTPSFDDNRATFAPGEQDYSALRAENPAQPASSIEQDWFAASVDSVKAAQSMEAEEAAKRSAGADLPQVTEAPDMEPTRPNSIPNQTMTMGVAMVPTPGGSYLYTYEQPMFGAQPEAPADDLRPSLPEAAPDTGAGNQTDWFAASLAASIMMDNGQQPQPLQASAEQSHGLQPAEVSASAGNDTTTTAESGRGIEQDWFAASVETAKAEAAATATMNQDRGASMGGLSM